MVAVGDIIPTGNNAVRKRVQWTATVWVLRRWFLHTRTRWFLAYILLHFHVSQWFMFWSCDLTVVLLVLQQPRDMDGLSETRLSLAGFLVGSYLSTQPSFISIQMVRREINFWMPLRKSLPSAPSTTSSLPRSLLCLLETFFVHAHFQRSKQMVSWRRQVRNGGTAFKTYDPNKSRSCFVALAVWGLQLSCSR